MDFQRVDEEYEKKMLSFEIDCNDGKGDAIPCHHVGEFLSVVKNNHEKASIVYKNNCYNKEYSASCFNLGRLYLSGKGVKQDDTESINLFKKSCDLGHLSACYHYASLLFLSTDSDINIKNKSLKIFEKACNDGELDSCYFIGSHYINKKLPSDERNPKKSIQYLTKSCNSNHAPSCFNLAVMYKNGDKDIDKNEDLFKLYKEKTDFLIAQFGGLKSQKTG